MHDHNNSKIPCQCSIFFQSGMPTIQCCNQHAYILFYRKFCSWFTYYKVPLSNINLTLFTGVGGGEGHFFSTMFSSSVWQL